MMNDSACDVGWTPQFQWEMLTTSFGLFTCLQLAYCKLLPQFPSSLPTFVMITITGERIRPVCVYNHFCIRCHGNHPVSQCIRVQSYPPVQSQVNNFEFNSSQSNAKSVNPKTSAPIVFVPEPHSIGCPGGTLQGITGLTVGFRENSN